MSSSISDTINRGIHSETLFFFTQLPFSIHFSDGPIVTHLDFSSSFRQIRVPSLAYSVPLENLFQYRDQGSPNSDSHSSVHSADTLSPNQTINDNPVIPDLVQSFDRLSLSSRSRRLIQARILEIELELQTLIFSLNSQRDQAILIVNSVSDIAIESADRRYRPQIEHLNQLLRRSD